MLIDAGEGWSIEINTGGNSWENTFVYKEQNDFAGNHLDNFKKEYILL